MNIPNAFGFYGILSNPIRGYEYLAQLLVDHEVAFVQLRMKKESEAEITQVAEKLRKITQGTKSLFVVNDSPQIAKAVQADGLHLGQDDMSVEAARKIVGPEMVIGVSTHTPDQTKAAGKAAVHYIGVGPVFPTPTKEKADPAIGIPGMKKMVRMATLPTVVLGSVDHTSLRQLLRLGARNFASVRPLNRSENPEGELKRLLKIYRDEVLEENR